MASKKAVAKKAKTDLVGSEEMPAFLKGTEGSNRGSEGVGADDLVIPRLELVQSISPCRKKNDPDYIEGAEEGMLFNNVTRELYDESVVVVPVVFKKEYLLWKDRKAGGGFNGAFDTQEDALAARADMDGADDIEVVDTAQNFCLLLKEDGSVEEIVVSLSKSKMKMSRRWNSMIRMNGGDRFSRMYRISTVEDSSDLGDFYNLSVAGLGYVTEEIYKRAEELYDAVSSGKAVASRDEEEVSGDAGEEM